MIIIKETTLNEFEAWSGAIDTKETILEHDKGLEFDDMISDLYPEGLSDTQLNDLLWFEEDWIYEYLSIELEDC